MFLALRGCEAVHWASWLPFPASAHPQYTVSSMGTPSNLGLAFSSAVRNEIHSPNQRVWRKKPVKGKAVLGTESKECFHENFLLGGEEPSVAEHSLTSGCWPRGEHWRLDLLPFRKFVWVLWERDELSPNPADDVCAQRGREAGLSQGQGGTGGCSSQGEQRLCSVG